ncbi:MAG: electron transport complex subunit E [Zetaproteobacteria bacterium]|nr:electron transport complex subunit E [Zetaproteobacteria bacterium]
MNEATLSAPIAKEPSAQQRIILDGLWFNNAIFAQLLGMCPLLGVTTSAENGLWMGLATLLVLIASNGVVSSIRHIVPKQVRIPVYITIIAAFVTIVDLAMNAWMHGMHQVLGLFIPLIVVNCTILGRAEAFASKNSAADSLLDALAMGSGFTLALVILGTVRELLGQGMIFGTVVFGADYPNMLMFILPPGAFIALGFILAIVNKINQGLEAAKKEQRQHPREVTL